MVAVAIEVPLKLWRRELATLSMHALFGVILRPMVNAAPTRMIPTNGMDRTFVRQISRHTLGAIGTSAGAPVMDNRFLI